MVVGVYFFPSFIFGNFVLHIHRLVINSGNLVVINQFSVLMVVAAAANACCRRAEQLHLSGLSDKHQKLGRIAGDIGYLE